MMFYQPGVQLVLHVNSTALPFMGLSYTTLAQAQARKFGGPLYMKNWSPNMCQPSIVDLCLKVGSCFFGLIFEFEAQTLFHVR